MIVDNFALQLDALPMNVAKTQQKYSSTYNETSLTSSSKLHRTAVGVDKSQRVRNCSRRCCCSLSSTRLVSLSDLITTTTITAAAAAATKVQKSNAPLPGAVYSCMVVTNENHDHEQTRSSPHFVRKTTGTTINNGDHVDDDDISELNSYTVLCSRCNQEQQHKTTAMTTTNYTTLMISSTPLEERKIQSRLAPPIGNENKKILLMPHLLILLVIKMIALQQRRTQSNTMKKTLLSSSNNNNSSHLLFQSGKKKDLKCRVSARQSVFCLSVLLLMSLSASNLSVWSPNILLVQAMTSNVQVFNGNDTSSNHFKLIERDGDSLLVGARNIIYNISLATLTENRRLEWTPTEEDVNTCGIKGQSKDACQNYIRVMHKIKDKNQLHVCGTNAFKPRCRIYEIHEDGFSQVRETPAEITCPYTDNRTVTSTYAGNEVYVATAAKFLGTDPLIHKTGTPTLRTDPYNTKQLNSPNFVNSFQYGEHVYFLFRESAIEYENCGKSVYSRIGRVCINDAGGVDSNSEFRWTSFVKARLNCSLPGEFPFYFNEIQSSTSVHTGYYNGQQADILYAVFTTPSNSIGGSAVCAYRMSDVLAAFNGPFKWQENATSNWLPVPEESIPRPRPGTCLAQGEHASLGAYSFITRNPLMDQAVNAFWTQPLVATPSLNWRFTQVAVDTQIDIHNQQPVDVVFVATSDGRVLKLFNPFTTLFPIQQSPLDQQQQQQLNSDQQPTGELVQLDNGATIMSAAPRINSNQQQQSGYQQQTTQPPPPISAYSYVDSDLLASNNGNGGGQLMMGPIMGGNSATRGTNGNNNRDSSSSSGGSSIYRRPPYVMSPELLSDTIIVEELQVFDTRTPIINLHVYHNNHHEAKLIVVSQRQIKSIPLYRCERAKTCYDCQQLRDPYCSWDTQLMQCQHNYNSHTIASSGNNNNHNYNRYYNNNNNSRQQRPPLTGANATTAATIAWNGQCPIVVVQQGPTTDQVAPVKLNSITHPIMSVIPRYDFNQLISNYEQQPAAVGFVTTSSNLAGVNNLFSTSLNYRDSSLLLLPGLAATIPQQQQQQQAHLSGMSPLGQEQCLSLCNNYQHTNYHHNHNHHHRLAGNSGVGGAIGGNQQLQQQQQPVNPLCNTISPNDGSILCEPHSGGNLQQLGGNSGGVVINSSSSVSSGSYSSNESLAFAIITSALCALVVGLIFGFLFGKNRKGGHDSSVCSSTFDDANLYISTASSNNAHHHHHHHLMTNNHHQQHVGVSSSLIQQASQHNNIYSGQPQSSVLTPQQMQHLLQQQQQQQHQHQMNQGNQTLINLMTASSTNSTNSPTGLQTNNHLYNNAFTAALQQQQQHLINTGANSPGGGATTNNNNMFLANQTNLQGAPNRLLALNNQSMPMMQQQQQLASPAAAATAAAGKQNAMNALIMASVNNNGQQHQQHQQRSLAAALTSVANSGTTTTTTTTPVVVNQAQHTLTANSNNNNVSKNLNVSAESNGKQQQSILQSLHHHHQIMTNKIYL